jgi:hypothetical protein
MPLNSLEFYFHKYPMELFYRFVDRETKEEMLETELQILDGSSGDGIAIVHV